MNNSNLAEKIEAAKHHVLFQHNPQDADGYITLAKKDQSGRFIQEHYKPDQLATHLTNVMGEDVFFSQNTFYRKARRIETIRQLRSLYVDLDFYVFNYSPGWILETLSEDFYRRSIPEPNLVIFSGQGLVLIWLIEPVPYKALPLWQAVQNYLVNQLKPLGGDPKAADAARVFRIAGSTSSKNGHEVRVEYRHNYRHTLREIQSEYLPELTPPSEAIPKKGRKKKVVHLYNLYSLYAARLKDLDTLVTIREGFMPNCREITLFLYRYWSCCFEQNPQEALRQTLEFNRTFLYPLSEKEAVRATRSAEKAYNAKSDKEADKRAKAMGYPGAGYHISNAKIIEWLNITPEEQMHMSTIIGTKEKNRRRREARRAAGMMTREDYLNSEAQKTISKMESLKKAIEEEPELSNRKMAKKIGISEAYVRKLKGKL